MKTTCVLLLLLIAGSLLATNEPPVAPSSRTNFPAAGGYETFETKVVKAYTAKDGNADFRAYVVLWKEQEVVVSDLRGESNLREGDPIKIMVMRSHSKRSGSDHEFLNFQIMPEMRKIPIYQPVPIAVQSHKQSVFFECRSNEVFFIDKDGLDKQLKAFIDRLSPLGGPGKFLRDIQEKEIGNECYKVIPSYLLAMIMALEPQTGVPGDNLEQLGKPDGKFQTQLAQLDPKTSSILFMVRNDSSNACQFARSVAEKRGFETSSTPLKDNEPIKFGTGNAANSTITTPQPGSRPQASP